MPDIEQLKAEFIDLFLGEVAEPAIARARDVLDGGVAPLEFFQQVFTPAMEQIGERFGRLEIFLPELMSAAEIASVVSEQIVQPRLKAEQSGAKTSRGKVLIGSVQGDLHDIGKNMVALMLEVNGFEVVDLGVDVAVKKFIDTALKEEADIVGLSSLMTTSMPYIEEVIAMRDGFGHKDKFAVIVGGAPITADYSTSIGADGFGDNAMDAVKQCIELIQARNETGG